jgi:CopG antitoxin of type II toxin-antitoxin system
MRIEGIMSGSSMAKSKSKNPPKFDSLGDLVDFFDSHDLGEYLEQMPESHFDVDLKQKIHLVALDSDLSDKLTEIAKIKQIPAETLINTWLRERISEPSA